jgi:hypothetical protein
MRMAEYSDEHESAAADERAAFRWHHLKAAGWRTISLRMSSCRGPTGATLPFLKIAARERS